MRKLWNINLPLTLSISSLLSIGILVIYSSSKELGLGQAIFAIVGLLLFFLISQFDYRYMSSFILPSYVIVILLLVFVLILGLETRGSVRWIPLGFFNVQPSEFAKPILIIILAQYWSKNAPSWKSILKSLGIFALPGILIYRQPDLGTFLTVAAIWVAVLFASRISLRKILVLLLIASVVIPVAWFTLHDYQRQRVTSFLSPNSDPLGTGYNIIQSTIAVGSGQFWGRGLGHGTQSRLQFLPEYRTDFIFASIAEELGFIGSLLILAIYAFLLVYCIQSANKSSDGFGYLIIYGVVAMLLFQTVVNIGMNMGMFPITGITLPLISYGGSSLISTLISFSLVASVIRYQKSNYIQAED